jgi:hypothetical protein
MKLVVRFFVADVFSIQMCRGSVDAFGVTKFVGIQNPTYSETCNGLSLGHGLVANVNNGGHWVLLTGESQTPVRM